MATFLLQDADVAAVYIKTGRTPGTVRYRQAPYLLVTYDDGTSGVMPVPERSTFNAGANPTVQDFEVDRIEIYDGDPFEFTKFGYL